MKSLKYLILGLLITFVAGSCKKGLDPINSVDPGPDLLAPVVEITYPTEGKIVRSADSLATITFKFVASDDIELKSVTMLLDGTEIGAITSFKDYRRLMTDFLYDQMGDGNHTFTVTAIDQTGKTTTQVVNFRKITAPPYNPMDGELLYFPFDDNYLDLIAGNELGVVGSPSFASGKLGDAYQGATDAYLTYPSEGIIGTEFSFAFWYKVNPMPVRGGILAISAPGEDRKTGFRMAREASGTLQNLFVNFGYGTDEVWINPYFQADPAGDWIHIAVAISATHITIYVNNTVVKDQDIPGAIDWTGCPSISIGSGAPNFTYWEHFSDLSLYDEMHFFNRAITAADVQQLYLVK